VTDGYGTAMTVTADDLDQAVQLAVAKLREASTADWEGKAGTLDWTCWETGEHLSDAVLSYAVTLGPKIPPLDGDVPFQVGKLRADGPESGIHADRTAGPAGLAQMIEACGGLLVAMVRTTPPETPAYHGNGTTNPEGFAAMGVVETLVHTHDITEGLGLDWTPPAELCATSLARMFPDAPAGTDPWPTLLWATGRGELPGHDRLVKWRWEPTPR